MSFRIIHLIKPDLHVRLRLDQLQIKAPDEDEIRSIPLADVAAVIVASRETSVTASALRRMAELNIPLLICNERFEPCSISLPYYRATNTECIRAQTVWTDTWKTGMWRQLIAAKIHNQAAVLANDRETHGKLMLIAKTCENPPVADSVKQRVSIDKITPSQRVGRHVATPDACESRAARIYWHCFFRQLPSAETKRVPGSRQGINGMLDYAYAVLRTAVLRSLAVHGFIAALGLHHSNRAGSFALADDIMEPLRPWADRELRQYLAYSGLHYDMQSWIPAAAKLLALEVKIKGQTVRMLHAIDLLVRGLQQATLRDARFPLSIPMIPQPTSGT